MDNHQDLHITLTLLAGVALACGVLYWSGRNAAPAAIASTSSSPAPAPNATLARSPLPEVPVVLSTPQPVAAQPIERERPVARLPAQEALTRNYDGPPLPVIFAFSERSLYTAEENDHGDLINVSKRVKEGIITNSSDKPLAITAIEVNIATQDTSQTQFVLSAGAQRHFGTDQGLKMIAGDQMTLRSPSFQDLVQPIP